MKIIHVCSKSPKGIVEACKSGCDPKAHAEVEADNSRLREVQKRMAQVLASREVGMKQGDMDEKEMGY